MNNKNKSKKSLCSYVQNDVEPDISNNVQSSKRHDDTKAREPITKENYKQYVFEKMPKSSHFKNMLWAFLVGGTICAIGQAFIQFYSIWFGKDDASVLASGTLVFVAALLTGFGVYDNIGRFAGAGSTIPITGFSNAVVSPALEFRAEGYIYGVGAKMFQVAGPVIVNGVTISVIIATLSLVVDAIFHIL
uniref:stage V sporulation protein AC n=1 Tax=Candidatus Fimenecus sp. TaxID=3022888 RepID=UPI0040269D92